jgi:hypothetical protein
MIGGLPERIIGAVFKTAEGICLPSVRLNRTPATIAVFTFNAICNGNQGFFESVLMFGLDSLCPTSFGNLSIGKIKQRSRQCSSTSGFANQRRCGLWTAYLAIHSHLKPPAMKGKNDVSLL